MGPIALFDKSFLQSLSIDESVWFDHFFLAVVPPFFYVETLADLGKSAGGTRTPEEEVRIIAEKFPDMHGTPCAFHVYLALANLAGHPVPMTGQIPMAGGRAVKGGGRTGVVFDELPEAKAFHRWQAGEFLHVEREFARNWRDSLSSLPLSEIANTFTRMGIGGQSSRTFQDAKAVADAAVSDPARSEQLIELALLFLGASASQRGLILSRWRTAGSPRLGSYAPYATFVLTLEVFFQVAVAANLISHARPSNRVDIAYLFYLPFCMVFVTSDRLQARCAPLFLQPSQDFVWGPDLKADLARLNEHFSRLPQGVQETSVFRFATNPPTEGDFLVARLWDKHLRPWRERQLETPKMSSGAQTKLVEQLKQLTQASELPPEEVDFDVRDPQALTLQRLVRKRKGSWWQLPKDLEPDRLE